MDRDWTNCFTPTAAVNFILFCFLIVIIFIIIVNILYISKEVIKASTVSNSSNIFMVIFLVYLCIKPYIKAELDMTVLFPSWDSLRWQHI